MLNTAYVCMHSRSTIRQVIIVTSWDFVLEWINEMWKQNEGAWWLNPHSIKRTVQTNMSIQDYIHVPPFHFSALSYSTSAFFVMLLIHSAIYCLHIFDDENAFFPFFIPSTTSAQLHFFMFFLFLYFIVLMKVDCEREKTYVYSTNEIRTLNSTAAKHV